MRLKIASTQPGIGSLVYGLVSAVYLFSPRVW